MNSMADLKNQQPEIFDRYKRTLSGFFSADLTFSTAKKNIEARKRTATESTERAFANTGEMLTKQANRNLNRIQSEEQCIFNSAQETNKTISKHLHAVKNRLESIKLADLLSIKGVMNTKHFDKPVSKLELETKIYQLKQLLGRSVWAAKEIEKEIMNYKQSQIAQKKLKRIVGIAMSILVLLILTYLSSFSCG